VSGETPVGGSGKAPDVMTHPLLQFLQEKGIDPSQTATITGYLALREGSDHARIYPDLQFQNSIVVPRKLILYVQPPDPSDATKPTHIVLKVEGDVIVTGSKSVGASFLRGPITSTNLS
jgi:hypothetical protein